MLFRHSRFTTLHNKQTIDEFAHFLDTHRGLSMYIKSLYLKGHGPLPLLTLCLHHVFIILMNTPYITHLNIVSFMWSSCQLAFISLNRELNLFSMRTVCVPTNIESPLQILHLRPTWSTVTLCDINHLSKPRIASPIHVTVQSLHIEHDMYGQPTQSTPAHHTAFEFLHAVSMTSADCTHALPVH